jgi:SAF domain
MAETRARERLSVAGAELAPRTGLRVRPQRPGRALFGVLLVVASVVVALTIYARVGDRHEVLAVTRTVLAGEQLSASDLRVVSISSDDSLPSVPSSAMDSMVGQYARVRMVQGSLLVVDSVQARPLVDPSKVLMSVPVPLSGVPAGLREGSRLALIVTPKTAGAAAPPVLVEATVAAVPRNLGELVGGGDSSQSTVALSVEVPPESAALVGSADAVAVAVLPADATFPASVNPGDEVTPSTVAGG